MSRMVREFALIATAIKAPAHKQVIHSPDHLQRSSEPLWSALEQSVQPLQQCFVASSIV